jgi:hypothetical protein
MRALSRWAASFIPHGQYKARIATTLANVKGTQRRPQSSAPDAGDHNCRAGVRGFLWKPFEP